MSFFVSDFRNRICNAADGFPEGNEPSASGGRYSEASEWQRSVFSRHRRVPPKIQGTATGRGSIPVSATRNEKTSKRMSFFVSDFRNRICNAADGFPEGNEPSASGGRYSEASEWQRSVFSRHRRVPPKIQGTATGRGSIPEYNDTTVVESL